MVNQYAPPVNVSPFIRFSRWALLLAGIGYGALWDMRYSSYETRMQPVWAQEKKERDEYLKAEKQRKAAAEMEELEALGKSK